MKRQCAMVAVASLRQVEVLDGPDEIQRCGSMNRRDAEAEDSCGKVFPQKSGHQAEALQAEERGERRRGS